MLLDAADSRTFADLVGEVGAQLLAGLAHPRHLRPRPARAAGIEKDAAGCSGDPIFPATPDPAGGDRRRADGAEIDLGTVRVRRETIPGNEAKHELEFTIVELRDGLIPVGMQGTLLYPSRCTPARARIRWSADYSRSSPRQPGDGDQRAPPSGTASTVAVNIVVIAYYAGLPVLDDQLAALAPLRTSPVSSGDRQRQRGQCRAPGAYRRPSVSRAAGTAVDRLVGRGRNLPCEECRHPMPPPTTSSSIAIRTTRSIRAGCS